MTRAHAIIFSLVGPEYLALLVDNDHCWHDGIVATVATVATHANGRTFLMNYA